MYVFSLNMEQQAGWTNGKVVSDATITVETHYLSGADPSNTANLIWFRASQYSGYILVVFGDGSYAILNETGGDYEEIVATRYHDSVHNYWNQPNLWRIVMNGSKFRIYCNNSKVAEFTNSRHSYGSVYLGGFSLSGNRGIVAFDNLRIKE